MRIIVHCLACSLLFCAAAHVVGQSITGTQLWSYLGPGPVSSCPAISPDGTIYLPTVAGLCAITNAGSNKWTFSANVIAAPTVGPDGSVYFIDAAGSFDALNADGSKRWSFTVPAHTWSSPALSVDGTLYFVSPGYLVAISSQGTLKWQTQFTSTSTPDQCLSPVIGTDGTIYVGSYYGHSALAFNPDGTLKWRAMLAASAGDSAAIAGDGTIYFTGGGLYAFTPTGGSVWSVSGGFFGSSPVVGSDGSIYVALQTGNQSLNAFSGSGQARWAAGYAASAYGNPTTAAAIDADGMIYYAASNSVFAINAAGNVQWIFSSSYVNAVPVPPTGASPTIGPDGTIYSAFGCKLYAIKGGTKSLATAPWPMYRQNLRHTGKVEMPTLTPPKKRADGNFSIQLAGEIGQAYTLQSTSNFLNWTSITNFVAAALQECVSDLTATNAPFRFYRATSP